MEKRRGKAGRILIICICIYALEMAVYWVTERFLNGTGLAFRSWIKWIQLFFSYLFPMGVFIGYCVWGIEKVLRVWVKTILIAALLLLSAAFIGGFFLVMLMGAFSIPDEKELGGRELEVTYSRYADLEIYLCKKVGPFFRTQEKERVVKERGNTQQKVQTPKPAQSPTPVPDDGKKEEPFADAETAYQKLYETVLEKEYPSSKPGYNAKGNFYSVLEEGSTVYQGEEVLYDITIVYDRESDDGTSQWFVRYKNYYKETANEKQTLATEILGGYAVNKKTGEVSEREIYW